MDALSNLSKEDLLAILGNMDKEVVEAEVQKIVPESMRELVDFLHTLLCKEIHPQDDEGEGCKYYKEKLWSEPYKKYWFTLVNGILVKNEVTIQGIQVILEALLRIETIKTSLVKEEGEKGLSLLTQLLDINKVSDPYVIDLPLNNPPR